MIKDLLTKHNIRHGIEVDQYDIDEFVKELEEKVDLSKRVAGASAHQLARLDYEMFSEKENRKSYGAGV